MLYTVVLCCLLCITRAHTANGAEKYTFGVVPQFEQRKLHAIWKPIIDELHRRTGIEFTLVSTLKIQDYEKEFLKGDFDFAYINPYHLLKAQKSVGYLPLVRDKAPLRGILVVRKDSPFQKPTELSGKVIAFPSPNALGASLLIRTDLERLHHVTVNPLFAKTHSSVYLHVLQGLAAAGGGVEKTLQEQPLAVRDALRVIYTTRSAPSHPITANPRVPQELRDKVRQALLDMWKTPEGRTLLAKVPIREMIPSTIGDYKEMSGWGLDAFWNPNWSED
jgi:phosphonate transport system substrate-binding protein